MQKTETIRRVLTLVVVLLCSLAVVSQSTPPGTQITNQAQASFEAGATPSTSLSNIVVVQGQAIENLTLTASQSVIAKSGSVVTLAHTLTNTGNAATDYRISYQNNPSGSSATMTLTSVKVYEDLNGNGIVDASDVEILSGSTVHLNAGGSAGLLVVMAVPVGAQTGATSEVLLTATSTLQNISASDTDTLTVAGVIASLRKTASATTASPNDALTFTLTAANSGTASADPIAITVDGASKSFVIIRDTIPANTTFAKISNTAMSQPLYHLLGDVNLNSYTAQLPADLSTIDAIAFALPSLPVNGNITVSFAVTVHANASGSLTNVAQFTYSDGGTLQQVSSPTVSVGLPAAAPSVSFVDSGYGKTVTAGAIGSSVYIKGIASACNLNPLLAEKQIIRIQTSLSHDDESFSAKETGPNTGVYTLGPIPTQNAVTNPVAVGDGILQVLENDHLTATLECGGKAVATNFFMDPAGVVFDSKSNAPLANAKVTLIDIDGNGNGGHPGQPAKVYAMDGVTSAPSTVMTGADGRFQFPQVLASTYRLQVVPPNGYKVASSVPPTSLPSGRDIDASGSYLGNFSVTAATGTVMIDVPADLTSLTGLFTEKTASKSVAEIGDFVDYTVTVKNNTGAQLTDLFVSDRFPKGFAYVKGTARLNNAVVADPKIASLTAQFPIGTLDANGSATLTYRLTIGPGSSNGKFANIAQAHSTRADSNQASAVVEVQGGVFDERGFIVGNVTTTCAGTKGLENVGVPGVKVYMEDGTYSITDSQGRYSFYGVLPATHVLKVDAYSLPAGTHFLATSNRSMSDGGTQFVDLKYGELRRADFHCDCNAKVKELVGEKAAAKGNDELSSFTKSTFNPDVKTAQTTNGKVTVASGTLSGGSDGVTRIATSSAKADISGYPLYTPEISKAKSSEEGAAKKNLDDSIGFVSLKNGDVLADSMANIAVKGPSGSAFTLTVNGVEVPKSKVGDRSTINGRIDVWTYIAVDLKTGHNLIGVSATDPFGNVRKATAGVVVNSEVAKVVITAPRGALQADGVSLVPVEVELFDRDGMAFKSEAQVTLETSSGAWLAKDFDEKTPGVQTFISGAKAEIRLLAPSEAGDVRLRISANGVAAETTITFVPALRPMTAAGVVEYALNFTHASKNSVMPVDGGEGFEDSLRLFSTSNSSFSAGGRSAMYLKGKIMVSNLLTMSYDSNKVSGTTMFRDIQPDQFYPVYGDNSTRGFDAQTTSKLYLRIDNGKSYLLYGDFLTSDNGGDRTITAYNRSLTGLKHHYDNGRLSATTFASYDTFKQVVQEFAANGTSGPFTFSYVNGIQNSEKVELLVRDRNHQAVILSQTTLGRFTEYEFEPFTGRLLLKSPVPTYDEDMNPIYIRVTYEVETGGSRFWSGGIDSQYKLNERMRVGFVAVGDANPQEAYQLYGLNYTVKPTKTGVVTAEIGNSHDQLSGSGIGYKVEYKEERKNLVSDVYLGRTTVDYVNQSATMAGGRGEAGAKFKLKLDDRSALEGDFVRSEDLSNSGTLMGAQFGFERRLTKRFRLRVDLRHAQQSAAPSQQNALSTNSTLISGTTITTPGSSVLSGVGPEVTPNTITTVGAKLIADLPEIHKSTVSAEFQQDVTDPDKHSFALGASTAIGSHGKIYARHEFMSSLGNQYTLNGGQSLMATVIGIDTDYLKHAHVFSEFRQHDELTNRDSEAAIGLRNLWQLSKGLGISAGFESIRTFDGQGNNNSVAVTGGVEFSAGANTRGSARAEWRGGSMSNSYLTTFSLGHKMGTRWTLLTRDVFLHQTTAGAQSAGTDQFRIQTGAAYRGSEASKWDALALFEFRNQVATGNPAALAGRLAVFSTNVNYQPARGLSFSGRYATKFLSDQTNGLSTSSLNQMFSYHVTKDLTRRMDVGLVGNLLANQSLSSRQQGLGAEVGFQLKQNLWISSGYNFLGFHENDLPGGADARQGAFVRLRFKFDENVLRGNGRQQLQQQDTDGKGK